MKRIYISLIASGALFFVPGAVRADFNPLNGPCNSIQNSQQVKSSPTCAQNKEQTSDPNNPNPVAGPKGILQTVTNIMALLTGIAAVGVIISGGITLITAGGNFAGQRSGDNPSKAKKARGQIAAAVIGLVIVALSWTILSFIIEKFVK